MKLLKIEIARMYNSDSLVIASMPAHKLGRQWQFKFSEVDEWLLSGKAAEKEETDLTKLNGGLEDGD